ncbi:membrane lipoprotein lipid attachment site-containing protein [Flavobacterium aciduliphilum]|uniref:Uncharacterized protein n=1 Tax=Flavobacterium aciduliphilum TaxID=1101402 RepID=A0A328YU68_9FLAO|nr:membrane lipoprotein lipid attachment site-containing protein [Flavobacterium aciduliphilum]RAR75752.1 hypothetical protein CLV55_101457 [Flavobacterium aciduliphilum]
MKKIVLILVAVFALSSCDRDGVGVTPGFVPKNAAFDFDSKLPSNLESSNPEVSARIQQMKSLTNVCGALMINSMHSGKVSKISYSQKNSNLPNHYTWSSGGYVVNYNYGIVGNNYEFDYTITINGSQFFTANGWEATNGSAGHWESHFSSMYVNNNYNITYDWSTNSLGDIHFDMHFDLGNTQLHYLFNLNHDNSGDITYIYNGTTQFYCIWDPNGHGHYTMNGQTINF